MSEKIDMSPNPDETYQCDNCNELIKGKDLLPVEYLTQRVAIGEPMPAGECPYCGCLCHPQDKKTPPSGNVYKYKSSTREHLFQPSTNRCAYCGLTSEEACIETGPCKGDVIG